MHLNIMGTSYLLPALVILAIVYTAYVSPTFQEMAVRSNTTGRRATYRWIDFLTKTLFVFLIAQAATKDTYISVVITLVFILFLARTTQRVVIETKSKSPKKNGEYVDSPAGVEVDVEEVEEESEESVIDDSVEVNESNGGFEFSSDKMYYSPPELNGHMMGVSDPDFSDEHGAKLCAPRQRVKGLIGDTVAESEADAVKKGLGLNVTSNQSDDKIYNVIGVVFELDTDVEMASVKEGFDNNSDSDSESESESDNGSEESEEMRSEGDTHHRNDMSGEQRVKISKAVKEAIEHPIESVAKEVEKEKDDVKVSDKDKEEVRKAVKFVVHRMTQDGKTVTHHDLLMICRMVYGQIFRCEGLLKTVVRDAGLEDN